MTLRLNKETIPINEVFFSYQGEGIFAGMPQIFVRTAGCNLKCDYCDTVKSLSVTSRSKYYTCQALQEYITDIYRHNKKNFFNAEPSVSFTGGEPLLYGDYLLELFKRLKKNRFNIYVETNGTLPEQIKKVYKYCDVVAMDIKFQSACKKDLFLLHRQFLENCKNKTFVKTVITKSTVKQEFCKALTIISDVSKNIKLVIQPSGSENIINKKVVEFYNVAAARLNDVRILPQLHKIWNIR